MGNANEQLSLAVVQCCVIVWDKSRQSKSAHVIITSTVDQHADPALFSVPPAPEAVLKMKENQITFVLCLKHESPVKQYLQLWERLSSCVAWLCNYTQHFRKALGENMHKWQHVFLHLNDIFGSHEFWISKFQIKSSFVRACLGLPVLNASGYRCTVSPPCSG